MPRKPSARRRAEKIWPLLYRFQRIGVRFIESHRRCMIADEMGTGKTVQTLAWLFIRRDIRPALVVCPQTVKLTWERLAIQWTPHDDVALLYGRSPSPGVCEQADIIVCNYDILHDWLPVIPTPKVVVFDECHYLRNRGAKRTTASIKVSKKVENVIFLSGTPVVNRPVEFFTALRLIDPVQFASFWDYAQTFCDPKHNGFGWDFRGASNLELLHKTIANKIMIRRKKEDVLTDLPDKTRSVVPLEIESREEYEEAEADYKNWVHKQKKDGKNLTITSPSSQAKIEGLKQIVLKCKINACVDWIQDFLGSGEKLVVFATHHYAVDELKRRFGIKAVSLDGRTPVKERQTVIDRFVSDKSVRLFVGNIQAAGVGIDTLQHAASNVAFIELSWVPGEHAQAEDRVHRIGQNKPVTCYYLIAHDTIEERIADMLDKKRKVLEKTLDGVVDMNADELIKMLAKAKRK